MTSGASLAVLAMVAPLLLLAPTGTAAQEVRGVAVGPQGEPLPGVIVALHRIGDTGAGANVASTTADHEGRFHFDVAPADSALYFAAMRFEERLYIGPPAMAGAERVTGYVLAVDPAAEAGAVASALSRPPGMAGAAGQAPRPGPSGPRGSQGALWLAALLALAAAAVFITTAPRYRRRRTREALVELAMLENQLASGADAGDRPEIVRRRDQLRERLAPPS